MKNTFNRGRLAALVALVATVAFVVMAGSSASAAPRNEEHPDHWGIITRNTIGSPVAALRKGPYGSIGVTGPSSRPPYGIGSLGIETANNSTTLVPPSEKVDFGNEVDFFGDPVLALNRSDSTCSRRARTRPSTRGTCRTSGSRSTRTRPAVPAPTQRWSGTHLQLR